MKKRQSKAILYCVFCLVNIFTLPVEALQICELDLFKEKFKKEIKVSSSSSKNEYAVYLEDSIAYWSFVANKQSLEKSSPLLENINQLTTDKEKKLKLLDNFTHLLEIDMFYKVEKLMDYSFSTLKDAGQAHIIRAIVGGDEKIFGSDKSDEIYAPWVIQSKEHFYFGSVHVYSINNKLPSHEVVKSRLNDFLKHCQIKYQ